MTLTDKTDKDCPEEQETVSPLGYRRPKYDRHQRDVINVVDVENVRSLDPTFIERHRLSARSSSIAPFSRASVVCIRGRQKLWKDVLQSSNRRPAARGHYPVEVSRSGRMGKRLPVSTG